MSLLKYKSVISYPYVEYVNYIDKLYVVTNVELATEQNCIYYIASEKKLSYGIKKLAMLTKELRLVKDGIYIFNSIIGPIVDIPCIGKKIYKITLSDSMHVFSQHNGYVGTQNLERIFYGENELNVENGSVFYDATQSDSKINCLKIKDGDVWKKI